MVAAWQHACMPSLQNLAVVGVCEECVGLGGVRVQLVAEPLANGRLACMVAV